MGGGRRVKKVRWEEDWLRMVKGRGGERGEG